MVHRTLTALQKSREVQLSRHREASEGSEDEACLRKENELVETGEGQSHGNRRECVCERARLDVCGHFVGLVAGKEL